MDRERALAELDAVIDAASAAERPGLVVALAARLALLGAALTQPASAPPIEPPGRWLTPEEAADMAGIGVKRLYDWARNKKWAARPTQRCLRIRESEFKAWLGRGRP